MAIIHVPVLAPEKVLDSWDKSTKLVSLNALCFMVVDASANPRWREESWVTFDEPESIPSPSCSGLSASSLRAKMLLRALAPPFQVLYRLSGHSLYPLAPMRCSCGVSFLGRTAFGLWSGSCEQTCS